MSKHLRDSQETHTKTTRCDIGCDQDGRMTSLELAKDPVTFALFLVTCVSVVSERNLAISRGAEHADVLLLAMKGVSCGLVSLLR
jgi:hypothetical protein